jgi:hypothetical protein
MSDVMKMDELLGKHQQMRDLGLAGAGPQLSAAMRPVRDTSMMKWAVIGLTSLFWGVPMIAMLSYGLWFAAHIGH